ncbi:hypothetical protein [Caldimonas tepidiphila]|uniref:hypothetical protein n=1 Tax=Caldimonas tepidiphila TaxID=2315841 RepID=UPI000E5A5982|nr:hypothetical protein [Caldimonas tepidiphila]
MSRRARQRADSRPWERDADLDPGLLAALDHLATERRLPEHHQVEQEQISRPHLAGNQNHQSHQQ